MTTDLIITPAQAAAILEELHTVKQALSITKKREAQLVEQLKQFMGLEGMDEFDAMDGQIIARLTDRQGTPTYDLTVLPDEVIARLAKIPGLLSAKHSAVKALGDTSMDLAELRRVEMPGTVTTSLTVEGT